MTDIEILQKKESDWEDAESQREAAIVAQISELYMQLSPSAQEELIYALSEGDDV